jgi:hypothetical protein
MERERREKESVFSTGTNLMTKKHPHPHNQQNELATLELIHALVEALDRHFGSVCELDIMFNLDTAHWALDEFVSGGGVADANKANALAALALLEKVPGG